MIVIHVLTRNKIFFSSSQWVQGDKVHLYPSHSLSTEEEQEQDRGHLQDELHLILLFLFLRFYHPAHNTEQVPRSQGQAHIRWAVCFLARRVPYSHTVGLLIEYCKQDLGHWGKRLTITSSSERHGQGSWEKKKGQGPSQGFREVRKWECCIHSVHLVLVGQSSPRSTPVPCNPLSTVTSWRPLFPADLQWKSKAVWQQAGS